MKNLREKIGRSRRRRRLIIASRAVTSGVYYFCTFSWDCERGREREGKEKKGEKKKEKKEEGKIISLSIYLRQYQNHAIFIITFYLKQ
jgi:hypothetical protein